MFGVFQLAILSHNMPKMDRDLKLNEIAKGIKEALFLAEDINERSRHL